MFPAVFAIFIHFSGDRACIKDYVFIDPPYNTGNDFVYQDNFTMTEEELANLSGDIENGVRLKKNPKDNARFHTNWLNMMYPRLKVARNLLADDGVVFISIGRDEIENILKICNEIFGKNNQLGIISRQMKSGGGSQGKYFAHNIDYIVVYCKQYDVARYFRGEMSENLINKVYNQIEKNGTRKGEHYRTMGLYQSSLGVRPSLRYYIKCPDGQFVIPPGDTFPEKVEEGVIVSPVSTDGVWRWSYELYKSELEKGNIEFKKTDKGVLIDKEGNPSNWNIYTKIWLKDRQDEGTIPNDLLTKYENRHSSKELTSLNIPFDFAKPVGLIKYLLFIMQQDKDIVVLDFFSGSATTAHAVMQLNAEDGGNRKFIMVQLPEETDEKSEAYKAGYKNICEIGKERIRRAAKKIHEDNPEAKFDDGFKVFKVDDTNIRWNTTDDEEIISLADNDYSTGDKDNIDFTPGHNDIDIVYEIMLRQFDIPLSTPIEKLPEVSDKTYIFANAVVVCLEPEIDEKLIEKLASIEPVPGKFVLRDSAFNDDIELKDVSYRRLSALIANHQLEGERKNSRNNYTVEFI